MKPIQQSFATSGFERFGKPTRRVKFLAEMDQVVRTGKVRPLIVLWGDATRQGRADAPGTAVFV